MSLLLASAFLVVLASAAQDKKPNDYPTPNLLIETTELRKPEVAGKFRIIDVRSKEKYDAGHIAGAVHVSATLWTRAFSAEPGQAQWAKRIGALGIDADTRVVVYGDAAVNETTRIWWILRYWGVKDVRLLNGGWLAWRNSGAPSATEEPRVSAKEATLTAQTKRLATKEQVLEFLKNKDHQLIDARSTDEYCGEANTARRNGSIPGAAHLEWSDLIDKKTQRFKGADELAKLLHDAGIDLKQPAVTYCQSGGRASAMAFALELMGGKEVRNYYKSWAEWGNAEDTPVVKPKPRK